MSEAPYAGSSASGHGRRRGVPGERGPLRGLRAAPVTTLIVALTVGVYIAQCIVGAPLTSALAFWAPGVLAEPWRIVTSIVTHAPYVAPASLLHILFNMLGVIMLGPPVERAFGRLRLAALYVISGIGGVAAVAVLAPDTVVIGASGAVFGLLAAQLLVVLRTRSGAVPVLLVLVVNLALSFMIPQVSWQAHLGGALTGAAVAAGLLFGSHPRLVLAVAFGVVLAVVLAGAFAARA